MSPAPSVSSNQKFTVDSEQPSSPPSPSQPKELSFDDLYGDGRPYPEPYAAGNSPIVGIGCLSNNSPPYLGKVPHGLLRERQLKRMNRESFVYSVRFRSGPLGIVFDNKVGISGS
jgi:hypothetical protein